MTLPVIAVTNESTVLTDEQIIAIIPALRHQVSFDFSAFWNKDCTLTFLPKGQPLTNGWWQLVIVDDPDQAGALGYHELTSDGYPLGKIFARLDIQSDVSWTVTVSHELLEMLGDPYCTWCAKGSDGKIYSMECGDPVEADSLGYRIDGVLVSDFITPAWFSPANFTRVDFKGHIGKPFEIAEGGYAQTFGADGWQQITARGTAVPNIPSGSRRARRADGFATWRRSRIAR